jgi:hypothetical protein
MSNKAKLSAAAGGRRRVMTPDVVDLLPQDAAERHVRTHLGNLVEVHAG